MKTFFRSRLRSVQWTKLFVQLAGCAFLLGFALKDFASLLNDYQNSNLATHVEVTVNEENFSPPQLVLHIPWYKKELRENEELMEIARYLYGDTERYCRPCEALANVSWNVWRDTNLQSYQKDISSSYSNLSMALFQRYLISIETNKDDVLDPSYSSWNEPIFYSILNFFIWQGHSDFALTPDRDGPDEDFLRQNDIYENTTKMDMVFSRAIKTLCEHIRFTETDFGSAFRFFDGTKTNVTCTSLLVQAPAPAYFNFAGLMLPLPYLDRLHVKKYTLKFLRPSKLNKSLWIAESGTDMQDKLWLFSEPSMAYANIYDKISHSFLTELPPKIDKAGYYISIRYSVQMRAKDQRPNRTVRRGEPTLKTCISKCTKEHIIKECGCVPFSMRRGLHGTANKSYCNPLQYSACRPALDTDRQAGCLSHCRERLRDFTSFNWLINRHEYALDQGGTEYEIWLIPSFTSFADFSWVTKTTSEQFLSQIGGLFGGYLGFSGFSIVAFIAISIDLVLKACKRHQGGHASPNIDMASFGHDQEKSAQNPVDFMKKMEAQMQQLGDELRSDIQTLKTEMESLKKFRQ